MTTYPLAIDTWDEREHAAIHEVLASGRYTMGARVTAFERDFARHVGSRHAVMVNSGSSANLLAVAALFYRSRAPLAPGDEVIVPAISWATTYAPLAQYGLRLRFVDVDLETLNMDPAQLASAITDRTRLVFAVNLLGNPTDFGAVRRAVAGRPIELLEDNCESLGAEYEGRQAGTFGAMGTFSFYFSHHISTMEGGMVVTDDDELFHLLLALRSHGWTRHLPEENTLTVKGKDPFSEAFRFLLPGYNLRPLEMSGAVGSVQLEKLPAFIAQRRRNAEHFRSRFASSADFIIQKETGRSSWFGFSLVIRPESAVTRDSILARLVARGIECRPVVAGNFARKEAVAHMDHDIHGGLPNASTVDERGFYVGNHHVDLRREIDLLAEVTGVSER